MSSTRPCSTIESLLERAKDEAETLSDEEYEAIADHMYIYGIPEDAVFPEPEPKPKPKPKPKPLKPPARRSVSALVRRSLVVPSSQLTPTVHRSVGV